MTWKRSDRIDSPLTFVSLWFTYHDERGFTIPLPWGWSTKVHGMARLGITGDDWRAIIPRAMGATKVETTAVFAYAVGIAWGYLTDRNGRGDDYAIDAHRVGP